MTEILRGAPNPLKSRVVLVGCIVVVTSAIAIVVLFQAVKSENSANHRVPSVQEIATVDLNSSDVFTVPVSPDIELRKLIIGTWNINYGNQDLREVSTMLRDSRANVLCLQETTEYSEAWLKRELTDLYPSQFIAGHKGKFFAEGFMVLSKSPILNPRFVPPVRTYFGHVVFDIALNDRVITIMSVHMTPFTTRESRTIPQLISAVGQTEADHRDEVYAVLNAAPENCPTVIVGDFNSPSHGVAPNTLVENGFTDLFAQMYDDPDQTQKSWDFRLPNGLRATWRIDYVFYSQHIKPIEAELRKCRSSDHHLLLGTLDLN